MFLTIKLCTNAKLKCFEIELIICITKDLTLKYLRILICPATILSNQLTIPMGYCLL